jgi:uncharacterized membrane protein
VNDGEDRGIIPTQTIADCSDYIDQLLAVIREAGRRGRAMPVEMLTMIQLYAVEEENPPDKDNIIHQQALMIAVCLQRLALR